MKCMYCGVERAGLQLQTIESIFPFDADEVSKLVGKPVEGEHGSDTLTVCVGRCADIIRQNSDVIIRDVPFSLEG